MTTQQKKNIGNGVRKAFIRKRQSDAMKASWARRRHDKEMSQPNACIDMVNNSTPPGVPNSQQLVARICRNNVLVQFTIEQLDDLVTLCEAFHDERSKQCVQ